MAQRGTFMEETKYVELVDWSFAYTLKKQKDLYSLSSIYLIFSLYIIDKKNIDVRQKSMRIQQSKVERKKKERNDRVRIFCCEWYYRSYKKNISNKKIIYLVKLNRVAFR